MTYLSAKKLAPSTISTDISALSYVHKIGSFSDPTKAFVAQEIKTAQSRLCSKTDIRLPKSQKARAPLSCRIKTSISTAEPSARQKSEPELDLLRWCRVRRSNSGSLFCLADGWAVETGGLYATAQRSPCFLWFRQFQLQIALFSYILVQLHCSLAAENGMSDVYIWGFVHWKTAGFKLYRQSPTTWAN